MNDNQKTIEFAFPWALLKEDGYEMQGQLIYLETEYEVIAGNFAKITEDCPHFCLEHDAD